MVDVNAEDICIRFRGLDIKNYFSFFLLTSYLVPPYHTRKKPPRIQVCGRAHLLAGSPFMGGDHWRREKKNRSPTARPLSLPSGDQASQ